MMPRSAQSSLSHCTTMRPGMLAGSSGTTSSSRPCAITMPPECWPEVARQVLDLVEQAREETDPPVLAVEPGAREAGCQRVVGVAVLEAAHVLRQAVDLVERDLEHLADLARGAAVAVGDHVGGHRRAGGAVALVDVLDHPLAPLAARQVEVDVGPLATLLGEEALEQQLHADRVDGGDAEAVADRAVRRRAAALHQDALAAAEVRRGPRRSGSSPPVRACRSARARARSAVAPSRGRAGSARARRRRSSGTGRRTASPLPVPDSPGSGSRGSRA